MEPHRAPLGGEGHATEAHESFHGEAQVGVISLDPRLPPLQGG